MASAIPPSPSLPVSAPSPLSYTPGDKPLSHGWIKGIMAELYKESLKSKEVQGFKFDAKVVESSLATMVKQIAKGALSASSPSVKPQEDVVNRLALLAINLGDRRLTKAELLEEIRDLPETLRNKLLDLEGVSEEPRRLAWFRNGEGESLLEALITHPESVEVKDFSSREVAPSISTDLTELEALIHESVKRFLAHDHSLLKGGGYNPGNLYRLAKYLYPDSERDRLELAKLVAARYPEAIVATLSAWGIQDEKGRVEIAEIIASRKGDLLCREDFKRQFNITDPGERLRLAIVTAKSNRFLTAGDFTFFDLEPHLDLMRFIELFSGKGLSGISRYLQMLTPEERLAYVKEAFKKESWEKLCGLADETLQILPFEERRAYAYRIAQETPSAFESLGRSLFEGKRGERRDFVFFVAQQHPYAILWDIKSILRALGKEDRLALIKLLAKAPKPSSEELALCGIQRASWLQFLKDRPWESAIDRKDITDRKDLLEITQSLAENFPEALSSSYVGCVFHPLETLNSEEALALARLLAKYSPHVFFLLSEFLSSHCPLSEEEQYQLIKEAAKAPLLSQEERKVKKFEVQPNTVEAVIPLLPSSEERRIEVAKVLAGVPRDLGNGAHSLAAHIPAFKIADRKERFEIAKIEAKGNPHNVAKYIELYDLTEEELFEVALIIARVDAQALENTIEKFGIKDRGKRFQIAWIAAETTPPHGGSYSWDTFKAFGIEDHPEIFLWAKKIAPYFSEGLCSYVPKIPEPLRGTQEERVLLAKRVALQCPFSFPLSLQSWGITDPTALAEISIASRVGKEASPGALLVDEALLGYVKRCEEKWFNEDLKKWSKEFSEGVGGKFERAEEEENKHYPRLSQEKYFLIARIGLSLEVNQVPLPLSEVAQKVLSQIVQYRNKEVAMKFASLFCQEVLADPAKREWFEEHCDNRAQRLPLIIAASLGAKGEALSAFKAFLQAGKDVLLNSKKPDQQMLLNALLTIHEAAGLSSSEKLALIEELSSSSAPAKQRFQQCLEQFIAFAVYIQVAKKIDVGGLPSEGMVAVINHRILASLKSEGIINLTDVTDFAKKYAATFGATRLPNALLLYATRLPKEPDLQEAILRYAKSVLEGEGAFKEERYSLAHSKHLATIAASSPEVWAKWKLGCEGEPLEAHLPARGGGKVFDFKSFFLEKLKDNHDRGAFATLRKYLENPTREVLGACREALESPIEGRPSQEAEAEKLLLQLCSTEGASPFELLQEIKRLLPQEWELQNDLSGAATILREKSNPQGLQVVDTDNWQDLLLAGTEVPGSCQRIDGSPDSNKCLLAYMLDGKNRMIAIKDRSGKLVARAILRLLLDSEDKPALFLERVYATRPEMDQVIDSFAKKRAADLGLALFSERSAHGKLRSLSSSVPYEYVDAEYLGETRGVFTIGR